MLRPSRPWSFRGAFPVALAGAALALPAAPASAASPLTASPFAQTGFAVAPSVTATIPITLEQNAYQSAYDETTGLLYVANPAAGRIDVVYTARATAASTGGAYRVRDADPKPNTVVQRLGLHGAAPFGLAIDQGSHRLYGVATATDELVIVQGNDGTADNGVQGAAGRAAVLRTVTIEGHIREARVHPGAPDDPSDDRVYLSAVNDDAILEVDATTGRVRRTLDDLVDRDAYPNAHWAAGLALNDVGAGPADDVVYATLMNQDAKAAADRNGLVTVVRRSTGERLQTLDARSHETTSIAYSRTHQKLYVVGQSTEARGDAGSVATFDVDPASGELTFVRSVRVGKGALNAAVDEDRGVVYVTDFGGGSTVTTLDAATGETVGAPLTVGARPLHVVVDPASHTAYVTNQGDATVSVLHAAPATSGARAQGGEPAARTGDPAPRAGAPAEVTGTIDLKSTPRPYQSAYDRTTGLLYVADPASERVHVVYTAQASRTSTGRRYVETAEDGTVTDPRPNTVVARIDAAGHAVYGLGINTRTGTLYGTSSQTDGGIVVAIDLRKDAVRSVVQAPGHLRDVRVDERRDVAYIADYLSDSVVEYDGARDRVVRTLQVSDGVSPLAQGPGGLAVDDEHGRIYVANIGDSLAGHGSISVIDGASGAVRQVIDTGFAGTTTVAYDATTKRVVATSQGAAGQDTPPPGGVTTFAVDPADGTLSEVGRVVTTPGALGTAIDGAGGYALSTNYGSTPGTVTFVGTDTGRTLGTVGVGGAPLMSVLDPETRTAYVVNQGDATVSVVSPGTRTPAPAVPGPPAPARTPTPTPGPTPAPAPKPKPAARRIAAVRLTLSATRVREGRRSVRLAVRVRAAKRAAAGSFRVALDGRTVRSRVRLSGGRATVTLRTDRLRPGRHAVRVRYAGSTTARAATATAVLRVVRR